MLVDGPSLGERQVRPVEARVSVNVGRDKRRADERAVGACRNLDVVSADELEDAERIGGRLLQRLVAGDCRHPAHLQLRARKRQEQRDRIVVPRVAVEEDRRGRHRDSSAQPKLQLVTRIGSRPAERHFPAGGVSSDKL
jgi:hypothetical protein